jgi:hypothetical protein
VRFLNAAGGDWSVPCEGDQDIDGCSMNSAGEALQMQVVRASNNEDFWKELNRAGSARVHHVAGTLADELIGAIRRKAGKYSASQKSCACHRRGQDAKPHVRAGTAFVLGYAP